MLFTLWSHWLVQVCFLKVGHLHVIAWSTYKRLLGDSAVVVSKCRFLNFYSYFHLIKFVWIPAELNSLPPSIVLTQFLYGLDFTSVKRAWTLPLHLGKKLILPHTSKFITFILCTSVLMPWGPQHSLAGVVLFIWYSSFYGEIPNSFCAYKKKGAYIRIG